MIDTPTAIRRFIDATNSADTAAFLDSFTADATLNDWGREFAGRAGIASWNETDNIGVRAHFELVAIAHGTSEHAFVATLTVTGDGYNGTGPMTFVLDGDRIAVLTIAP